MREVSKNQHAHMWTEAIEARFERGKPWGREEFDRLLGKYEIGTPQFISLLDLACTGVLEGYLGAFIESYTKTNTRYTVNRVWQIIQPLYSLTNSSKPTQRLR